MTAAKKVKEINLSASSLKLFKECPRCFYLQKVKGIHRPKQLFSLQNNFDRILKTYFDGYREKGMMPPELEGSVEGRLFRDRETLERWRDALHPTLEYRDPELPGFRFSGGIDDCLEDGGALIPIDYKTTGSASFEEHAAHYYQTQLDSYELFLREQGKKTKGFGYLVYYKPEEVTGKGVIRFRTLVKMLDTEPERAKELFREAVALLRGTLPAAHSACTYCSWSAELQEID